MTAEATLSQPTRRADAPRARPGRWSLGGAVLRGGLAGLAVVVACEVVWILFFGNVRVVIPGQIYRGSQPSPDMVESMVRQYGIRTIVNLRGYGEGSEWYDNEQRAASKLGVSVEDLSFSANRLPSTREIRHLVEVLDRSERPILIHCFRGVDRTGMASVIALLLYTDMPLDEAVEQLSLRYLHLPFGRTGHLDRFFDLYRDWLRGQAESHSPANLRTWLRDGYTAGPCSCRLELIGAAVAGPVDLRRTAPQIGRSEPPHEASPPSEPLAGSQRVAVPRGQPFGLRIRCHNTSVETWRFDPNLNVGIHGSWQLWHNRQVIGRGRVGAFRAEVPPGHFLDLWLPLPSLCLPGSYRLQVGLYEENHGHFHEQGADALDLDLELEAP